MKYYMNDCALPEQARKAYRKLAGPKKLFWTSGSHFEFYGGPAKVRESVEALTKFFRTSLA
jgi:uncharacterized protein